MARGKHLSLEEARKKRGGIKPFAKEHPATGDADALSRVVKAMASGKKPAKVGTKGAVPSAGSSGTRSRED